MTSVNVSKGHDTLSVRHTQQVKETDTYNKSLSLIHDTLGVSVYERQRHTRERETERGRQREGDRERETER